MLHPWQINYFCAASCTSRNISLSADRRSGRLSEVWAERALAEWGKLPRLPWCNKFKATGGRVRWQWVFPLCPSALWEWGVLLQHWDTVVHIWGVCHRECKRSRERLVAVADRCQHNLLKCMKGQGWHLEAQLGDSELVIPKWNSVLRKTCSKFDHFTRGNSALTQVLTWRGSCLLPLLLASSLVMDRVCGDSHTWGLAGTDSSPWSEWHQG